MEISKLVWFEKGKLFDWQYKYIYGKIDWVALRSLA